MRELFDVTTNLLSKALEYRGTRHRLLSNNIANLDTPNYKAVDIKFEDALQQVRLADSRNGAIEGQKAEPKLVLYASNGDAYSDGNTVEIEEQVMKMTENNILHNSFVNLIKMKFRMLESAISEARR